MNQKHRLDKFTIECVIAELDGYLEMKADFLRESLKKADNAHMKIYCQAQLIDVEDTRRQMRRLLKIAASIEKTNEEQDETTEIHIKDTGQN